MKEIIPHRLSAHLLSNGGNTAPEEVVHHMLCMQSQDFTQAKRAIASRAGCSDQDIVDAFNTGKLVRTWTQRGTIHTVCAEDAAWMVQLCASKTLGGFKKRREYLGITDTEIDRILERVPVLLSEHGPLSRKQIASILASEGFDLSANKPYHIMCYAGTLGLTVQGPVVGKEHCFVVAPTSKTLIPEQAGKELCLRYFTSHGPATVDDLQRRSGIGKTQIKQGIEACGSLLQEFVLDGKIYYRTDTERSSSPANQVLFLAGFDERLLGYKDRTATLDREHHTAVDAARNGIFKPTVMVNGKTVGIWTIKHKSKYSEITIKSFEKLTKIQEQLLQEIPINYQKYLVKDIVVTIMQ